MQKKISKLPFKGTPEQAEALQKVIDANKHDPSRLMGVMQEAQGIYGYLPIEVQQMIADGMNVPLEKVYGVATFYAQFSLSPKGEYNISVCIGTACYVKGAGEVFDKIASFLGIPYPGGKLLDELASYGHADRDLLPRPYLPPTTFTPHLPTSASAAIASR